MAWRVLGTSLTGTAVFGSEALDLRGMKLLKPLKEVSLVSTGLLISATYVLGWATPRIVGVWSFSETRLRCKWNDACRSFARLRSLV